MRLDKFLSDAALITRSEASKAVRAGRVSVDDKVQKSASVHIDPEKNRITFDGKILSWQKFTYIMLNKPAGYVSTTDTSDERCVLHLLPPEYRRAEVFPCGRLDIDTLGLLLLTSNGPLAHNLLSPKHHVEKTYYFKVDSPLDAESVKQLEGGVDIGEDKLTMPAKIVTGENGSEGYITIVEGKFHQIKRMLEAVGRKITYLERVVFGPLKLDSSLSRGEWRHLSDSEVKSLLDCGS